MRKKAPGILPSPTWLRANGYGQLYNVIRQNPEAFAHIKQRCGPWRSEDEWVVIAEQLAKQHKGLPGPGWLKKNGFASLYRLLRTRPHRFAHIKQSRKCRHVEQWVIEAEKLTKRHGKLPRSGWLVDHGFSGLVVARSKNPGRFAHIPQQVDPRQEPSPSMASISLSRAASGLGGCKTLFRSFLQR